MDHEKIPYVVVVHGIDGTDINMILLIGINIVVLWNCECYTFSFVKQNEDDAKHCANEHGMDAQMETNS